MDGGPGAGVLTKSRPAAHLLTVIGARRVVGVPPRERNPELSADHLVVTLRDARGQELTRLLIQDPRLLRAETVGPGGQLTFDLFYRADVEFIITLPDDPGFRRLEIHQPRWTESGPVLDLIGEVPLP